MIEIITILKLIVICWALKDLFLFASEIIETIKIKNRLFEIIKLLLVYLLSCSKCNSMWLALILSGNLLYAAVVSIIINLFTTLEYKYKKTEL